MIIGKAQSDARILCLICMHECLGTEEGGRAVIAFLEETKACFKPQNEPFDPG
jgi:hypothetical protein